MHFGAHLSALRKACSLVLLKVLISQPRLAHNPFQVRPMHPFGRNFDRLLLRTPRPKRNTLNQLLALLLHTIAKSALSRVRTQLYSATVNPIPCTISRADAPAVVAPSRFGDLPSSPHPQMEALAAPFRIAAYGHLCHLPRRETQQRVYTFRDVSHASSVPAQILKRRRSQIARPDCHT